jgi:hypothetical protein
MDHVVLFSCLKHADLKERSPAVGADQHGEVRLIRVADPPKSVVDCMVDVVVGDAVLASTCQDLHSDNTSCHKHG